MDLGYYIFIKLNLQIAIDHFKPHEGNSFIIMLLFISFLHDRNKLIITTYAINNYN